MFIIFPRRLRRPRDPAATRRTLGVIAIAVGGIFMLSVIGGVYTYISTTRAVKRDVAASGEILLKDVPHSFGDLKSALSPLSPDPAIEDCVGGGSGAKVRYYNCKMAVWGRGQLFMAIFISRQGYWAPKNVSDDRPVAGIRINSEFRGTLCGKSMREVMDSGTACGARAEIERNGNGASFIYVGLRRDSVNRPIY